MKPPTVARWIWRRFAPERIAQDAHDDLVFAVAIGVWWGSQVPNVPTVRTLFI